MPFLVHSSISDWCTRREELVMSGYCTPAPEQNSLNPPPDPVDSILGVLKSVVRPNRSATTVENGYTVDEPTMLM